MRGEIRQDRQSSGQRRRTRAQQVQNRRFTLAVCVLAVLVVVTAVASYSARAEATSGASAPASESTAATTGPTVDPAASLVSANYTAELRGDYNSVGSGRALLTLNYNADTQAISYVLEITSPLGGPNVAAICQGSPGQVGTTVFTLFAGPAVAGNFSGILSQGEIAASDLVGPLQGGRVNDLALMLSRGEAYATIGTVGLPVDAVRGQIQ